MAARKNTALDAKLQLVKASVVAAGALDPRRVAVTLSDGEYEVRILTPDLRGVVRRFMVKP